MMNYSFEIFLKNVYYKQTKTMRKNKRGAVVPGKSVTNLGEDDDPEIVATHRLTQEMPSLPASEEESNAAFSRKKRGSKNTSRCSYRPANTNQ